jgi:PAS domain S-box-containing protein
MKAPLPDQEKERIRALLQYHILDTESEESFNDLVRLASYICGTPVAFISLVDQNRQWFKAKIGLDISQTSRDLAFCSHTILQPDVLIVPDATKDKRFATHPFVTGNPHIRFYAGVPLINPEGYAIGTVCAVDYIPRKLSPEQIEALSSLGRQVIKQMELRRNLASLVLTDNERQKTKKLHKLFLTRLIEGFGLASVILIFMGVINFHNIKILTHTNQEIKTTQETIHSLEQILSYIKDAETGQRGYIITGDKSYLQPYQTSLEKIEPELEYLSNLKNDQLIQANLKPLQKIINIKLKTIQDTIELRQSQGLTETIDVIKTNEGKNIMDNIRQIIHNIETQKNQELQQQLQLAQVRADQTIVTLGIGVGAILLLFTGIYYFIAHEVNQRKLIEDTLKQERNFISQVLNTADVLVVVLNIEGKIIRCNQACEILTGYTLDEVRERYFWDIFLTPEQIQSVKAVFQQLQSGQLNPEFRKAELYWRNKYDSKRLIASSNTVLRNSEGEIEYIITTGVDITERKQKEEELKSTTSRLSALIENLQAGVLVENENGKIALINQQFCDIFGLDIEPPGLVGIDYHEMAEQTKQIFVHPEQTLQRILHILAEKQVVTGEEIELVDGRILKRDYIPIFVDEHYQGHLWKYRDVSQRKLAQTALRQSQARLSLINSILSGISTGMTVEEIIAHTIYQISEYFSEYRVAYSTINISGVLTVIHAIEPSGLPPLQGITTDLKRLPMYWEKIQQGEILVINDVKQNSHLSDFAQTMLAHGTHALLDVPLQHSDQLVGLLCFDAPTPRNWQEHEITLLTEVAKYLALALKDAQAQEELTRNNLALELATKEAEAANKAKSEFLANMSHEIRTPMNAILGFADLLQSIVTEPQAQSYLKTLIASGKTLLSLINDILDLSKIEAGKIELQHEPVNLRVLITEIQQIFADKATKKNLIVSVEITENVPEIIVIDEVRLRQILFNVVGNALKFTDQGYIKIIVRADIRSICGEEKVYLEITVEDTGIGIDENQQELIFEKFVQSAGQSNRKYGGTGLGLAITRRLTEMMGGTVRLESELGKGSVFTFIFPELSFTDEITDLVEYSSVDDDLNQFSPSKILVVDDVESNRQLLQGYFAGSHHQLFLAEDGESAISWSQIHHPDLILLDLRMPGMDGKATSIYLKSQEDTQHIPIVILTASSYREEELEMRQICQGFLRKPVSRRELVAEMKKHLLICAFVAENSSEVELCADAIPDLLTTPVNLRELLAKIREEEEMVWINLRRSLEMREIENFIARLELWSAEHQYQILADYVNCLKMQLDAFDWQNLPETINKFPSIRETLAGEIL